MANVITDRDQRILDAAVQCALASGYDWITREEVARLAGVATGTVNSAFGTVADLKRAVLAEAVEKRILPIIAQGLAGQHAIIMSAPLELRQAAALQMAG